MQTARFWVYHQGLVRIKIKAGQTVSHTQGGRTDEGWYRASEVYSFDGETVTCEYFNDGADCDGRHSSGGISFCRVADLAAGYSEDGIASPAWQHGRGEQRDYAAEAMGY